MPHWPPPPLRCAPQRPGADCCSLSSVSCAPTCLIHRDRLPTLQSCVQPLEPRQTKCNPLCGTGLTALASPLQKKNDLLYKTALRRKARRLAVKFWMLTWEQKETEGNLECLYAALFRDSVSEAVKARLPEGPVRKMLAPPPQVGVLAWADDGRL